jgi:hypothetical protein
MVGLAIYCAIKSNVVISGIVGISGEPTVGISAEDARYILKIIFKKLSHLNGFPYVFPVIEHRFLILHCLQLSSLEYIANKLTKYYHEE